MPSGGTVSPLASETHLPFHKAERAAHRSRTFCRKKSCSATLLCVPIPAHFRASRRLISVFLQFTLLRPIQDEALTIHRQR